MDTFIQESADYRDNRLAHWEGVYQKSPSSLGDHYRRRLQVTCRHLVSDQL